MSSALENLIKAQKYAVSIRPQIGGFPVLAEVLRRAGVTRNFWTLPFCQSLYLTKLGPVVQQGPSLVSQSSEVPEFSKEKLIAALRIDQAGKTTFFEFLKFSWEAGVISYDVDFEKRTCTYYGAKDESYVESYSAVDLN